MRSLPGTDGTTATFDTTRAWRQGLLCAKNHRVGDYFHYRTALTRLSRFQHQGRLFTGASSAQINERAELNFLTQKGMPEHRLTILQKFVSSFGRLLWRHFESAISKPSFDNTGRT